MRLPYLAMSLSMRASARLVLWKSLRLWTPLSMRKRSPAERCTAVRQYEYETRPGVQPQRLLQLPPGLYQVGDEQGDFVLAQFCYGFGRRIAAINNDLDGYRPAIVYLTEVST